MENIQEFCGLQKNATYTVWYSDVSNFSYCFLWMLPSNVTHGIFILFCVYLYGLSKHDELNKRSSTEHWIKKLIPFLIILDCILEIVLSITLNHVIPAYILAKAISLFCWSFYLVVEYQAFPSRESRKRKNWCVLFGTFLVLTVCGLELYTVIKNIKHYNEYYKSWPVQYYGTFVYAFFVLCFIIAHLANWNRDDSYILFGDGEDEDAEKDIRYSGGRFATDYKEFDSTSSYEVLTKKSAPHSPGFFSQLTLWWVNDVISKGNREELKTTDDLLQLPKGLNTSTIRKKFLQILRREKIVKGRSLFSILSGTYYGRMYYSLALLKLIMMVLDFSGPIFLNFLIKFMENRNEPAKHGYYYAAALFLTSTLNVFTMAHYYYYLEIVRVFLRGSLITSIYDKTLKVSSSTLNSRFSTGQIVNFMTTDVDRIVESCFDFHELWGVPIQLGVCIFLLYTQVGLAVIASVGVIFFFSPVTWFMTMRIKRLVGQMMKYKDQRVKVISEILNGIRVIKFYAWERHFEKVATDARAGEMRIMKMFKYLQAVVMYIWVSTPYIMCVITFSTYVMLGYEINAATVFTTMSLLSILNTPLNDLPWAINGVTNAYISLKRLDLFLSMPEIDNEGYYLEISNDDVFDLKHGTFKWKDDTAKEDIEKMKAMSRNKPAKQQEEQDTSVPFVLRNINLTVKKGAFIGITGKVGAGKSSLFAALIHEMQRQSGILHVDKDFDGFAYVAQEAWIQNMTVRDNILYGKPFDQQKYDQVIYACALEDDLKILPAGDMTEIGENGINLSGGQKARVAFARAVYQDKDVYIMDDPLAAVDSHVAAHLFEHCIMGILRNKTRVLSTHHVKFLRNADNVILMKDGVITENGSPEEVLATEEVVLLERQMTEEEEKKEPLKDEDDDEGGEEEEEEEEDSKKKEAGKLVTEEERKTGTVGFAVYKFYMAEIGVISVLVMFIFMSIAKSMKTTGDWWMAYWTSHMTYNHNVSHNNVSRLAAASFGNITGNTSTYHLYNNYPLLEFNHYSKYTSYEPIGYYGGISAPSSNADVKSQLKFYLGVYCGVMLGGSLGTLIRTLANAYGCVRASYRIHKKLLNKIMSAPVSFFDITPVGRLINRFSSDIYAVDSQCAFYSQTTVSVLMTIFVSFVMASYSVPYFTIIIIPLAIIYYFVQKLYRKSSRELKRLSTISRSPIYTHFSETLSGMMTIRAFREIPRFTEMNETKLEANQRAYFSTQIVEVWLTLRLGTLGVIMLTGVAFLAVLEHTYHSISPGLVGLAVSISLAVQGFFLRLVTLFTRLEKAMVNTERVLHYITETEPEPTGFAQVPRYWPTKGAVSFRNVCLRYREDLPLVLDNLSLDIFPAEKIGICGRTGSGKSSLFRLLFKIVELTSGDIMIDDISVRNAITVKIREGMSIIPQDPFLFDDSVSRNLDPKDEYTDEDKFDVIEKCHLTKAVQDLGGLQGKVGERGSNLSAGQKQLICLARALLKKSKVICIDEATASVDLATDNLIQETIRTEFASSTVLTIAHRLDTIIDSDRVLVMDYGQVAEFAPPNELLSDPTSLFSLLVKKDRQKQKRIKRRQSEKSS